MCFIGLYFVDLQGSCVPGVKIIIIIIIIIITSAGVTGIKFESN